MNIHHLTAEDLPLMDGLLTMFGEAFDDLATYTANRPDAVYLQRLLSDDTFIALAAVKNAAVIGGLVAYELRKFEQARSELYIYDLAVAAAHRREGVATALIRALQAIAATRGITVIFVQANTTPDDEAALALYSKLGTREDVVHFDLGV
ncbi:AAC(3)-I family aminoglycoside N-acetyltransferase [Candidatus Chloroploca asiatica]|uniref:AAC(3)-I family aminoglycoside 3-N-acetyltransferase n=1 Tax=Candidatus Chloroploca asiatica TaxID=1506545 RepID=A0A2H3KRX6_9CHLR|nr:AAC(3)-I family aminoglycoside N-acetyltransferase [Candidatus Chloroploca asiatica]PDW00358.1 AAC(3)-I family aminoglycoside 3-N-acetyltransferase [Candidatus Chloroploca asiatica]